MRWAFWSNAFDHSRNSVGRGALFELFLILSQRLPQSHGIFIRIEAVGNQVDGVRFEIQLLFERFVRNVHARIHGDYERLLEGFAVHSEAHAVVAGR